MLTNSNGFKKEVKRADKSNVMDVYASGEVEDFAPFEKEAIQALFDNNVAPEPIGRNERMTFVKEKKFMASLQTNDELVLASDAFFPFSDNVHRAARSGVSVLVAPGGSVQDEQVLETAKGYGMTVVRSPWRLFHH